MTFPMTQSEFSRTCTPGMLLTHLDRFLSEIDRARVIRRLKSDQQSSAEHEEFKMAYFWASVKDWKTYAFATIY